MRFTTLVLAVTTLALTACGSPRAVPARPAPPIVEAAIDPRPLLRATLAARRNTQIARLVAYRDAGAYTTDASGLPRGVFRDAAGRHCAMASLIASSGRMDLVDTVAATDNTLELAEVHTGPLHAWMLDSGMTQEEIAMVQGALPIDLGQYDVIETANGPRLVATRGGGRGPRGAKQAQVAIAVEAARAEVTRRLTDAIASLQATAASGLDLAVERASASPKRTTAAHP